MFLLMYYDILIKLLYNIFIKYSIIEKKNMNRELLYMQVSKRKHFLANGDFV